CQSEVFGDVHKMGLTISVHTYIIRWKFGLRGAPRMGRQESASQRARKAPGKAQIKFSRTSGFFADRTLRRRKPWRKPNRWITPAVQQNPLRRIWRRILK